MTPYFNKLLVTERPLQVLSLKNPSFSHLIVKQVIIFGKKFDILKISTKLTTDDVEKFLAILSRKAPIF